MFQMISLILKRVKRFIFNFPSRSTIDCDLFDVVFGYGEIGSKRIFIYTFTSSRSDYLLRPTLFEPEVSNYVIFRNLPEALDAPGRKCFTG